MVRPMIVIDLVIVGPTSSGKSHLARTLAHTLNAEVISADSRQIYREISVGTGKVPLQEQRGITHHLMDFYAIDKPYSAGDFVRDAQTAIRDIRRRGKKVILCGGTGLYIDSLLFGLVDLPERPLAHYEAYRKRWESVATTDLFEKLKTLDQTRSDRIHPNDRFRILRALYLMDEFSLSPTDLYKTFRGDGVAYGGVIGLDPGRENLHQRIRARVNQMFEMGWIEEVESLLKAGTSPDVPGFNSLGYRDVVSFLKGEQSRADLEEKVLVKTRQYAKRQMTWFRHMQEITWVRPEKDGDVPLDLSLVCGTIGKISC